jgi:hypothetical protein
MEEKEKLKDQKKQFVKEEKAKKQEKIGVKI